MTSETKKKIYHAIREDDNRRCEHQETVGLRLTKEQIGYLSLVRKRYGLGRGSFMRRLLIKEMILHELKDEVAE